MIQAYRDGKDLYATIACGVYHNKYWDNMEHNEDGTPNPEGKKRRSNCKSLLLGIMYSRGASSIAEQINSTKEEAQEIIDNFYKSFPKVKEAIENAHKTAKQYGYVEDLWGRRRRLSDIQLPKYTITKKDTSSGDFNPLLMCNNSACDNSIIDMYYKKLNNAKSKKDREALIKNAKTLNLNIVDNSGVIAQAERQCLNAQIQSSAATMTKIAMTKIFNDKELNDLGFKLLIGVHDELIGECPVENKEKVADRLTYVMKTCIADTVNIPFKCDADICDHWYYNDYCNEIISEYSELLKMSLTHEGARDIIYSNHKELNRRDIDEILDRSRP